MSARLLKFRHFTLATLLCAGMLMQVARAQGVPTERTFRSSKAEVQKVLRNLRAYAGGRLPTLDGFAVSGEHALADYKHGFYQYSIDVVPTPDGQVTVRVSAKITAQYAARYDLLLSNGRLESDLLDNLEEGLTGKPVSAGKSANSVPEGPAAPSAASVFTRARGPIATLPDHAAPPPPTLAEEKRLQQLREEAKNLEDILVNQTRPDNLAIVMTARTPVLSRPAEGAQVLLLADPEDEFPIIENTGQWVHVQISGMQRGWIQRWQLQLPGATGSVAAKNDPNAGKDQPFKQTREETSLFPGDWEALRGKKVRIIWVEPSGSDASQSSRAVFAKSVFKKEYPDLSKKAGELAGVVIVFDAKDGGMAATTMAALQQWRAGHLSDDAFWKKCWFDPADVFKSGQ